MGSKDYITAIYQSLHQYVKILDISDRGVLTISIKDKGVFTINERDVKFLLH